MAAQLAGQASWAGSCPAAAAIAALLEAARGQLRMLLCSGCASRAGAAAL